jgi:hypothetical protein
VYKEIMTDQPKVFLMAQTTCLVGDIFLDGPSPKIDHYHVVFEDDGNTGYLYAYDLRNEKQPILDALHIYNVQNIEDREKPSLFQIFWSSDGLKAALFINHYPHAVFDLESQRGYCRTNFPPTNPQITKYSHEWTDECLNWF